MVEHVTDPNDPRLGHGVDAEPIPQHETYLILSDEERAKGFVRPVRRAYMHMGEPGPEHPLRDLTDEEHERYDKYGYVKFEEYPESESPVLGNYWTQERLDKIDKGCHTHTTMSLPLAETYARDPKFYGATYCVGCGMHLAVKEFVWVDGGGHPTKERVGS